MDHIEDMYERRIGKRHHEYRHRDYGSHHDSRHFAMGSINSMLVRFFHNKALLLLVGGILISIVIVLVLLGVALFPYASQSITYLNENGLKGIVDTLLVLIYKLWEGTGKK